MIPLNFFVALPRNVAFDRLVKMVGYILAYKLAEIAWKHYSQLPPSCKCTVTVQINSHADHSSCISAYSDSTWRCYFINVHFYDMLVSS